MYALSQTRRPGEEDDDDQKPQIPVRQPTKEYKELRTDDKSTKPPNDFPQYHRNHDQEVVQQAGRHSHHLNKHVHEGTFDKNVKDPDAFPEYHDYEQEVQRQAARNSHHHREDVHERTTYDKSMKPPDAFPEHHDHVQEVMRQAASHPQHHRKDVHEKHRHLEEQPIAKNQTVDGKQDSLKVFARSSRLTAEASNFTVPSLASFSSNETVESPNSFPNTPPFVETRPGAVAVPGTRGSTVQDEELGDAQTVTSMPNITARVVEMDEELLEKEVLELRAEREQMHNAPVAQILSDEELALGTSQKCLGSPRSKKVACAAVLLLVLAIVAVVLSVVLTRDQSPPSNVAPQVSFQKCMNDTDALVQGSTELQQAKKDSEDEVNAVFGNCNFTREDPICIIDEDTFASTPALDSACITAGGIIYKYTALATCTSSGLSMSFTYKNIHACFASSCDERSVWSELDSTLGEELTKLEQEFMDSSGVKIECDVAINSVTDASNSTLP